MAGDGVKIQRSTKIVTPLPSYFGYDFWKMLLSNIISMYFDSLPLYIEPPPLNLQFEKYIYLTIITPLHINNTPRISLYELNMLKKMLRNFFLTKIC